MISPDLIGSISGLAIYPLKSGHRIDVNSAHLTPEGLETTDHKIRDHDFMLVYADPDDKGIKDFANQRLRGMNTMALIRPQIDNGALVFTWNDQDPIEAQLDFEGPTVAARIWDDVVYPQEQNSRLSNWFSQHLDQGVALVRAVGDSFRRPVRQNYLRDDEHTVRFQDGYAVHFVTEESDKEVWERAGVDDSINRWRAQVRAKGFKPQFEHRMHRLTFNEIEGVLPKPCERCKIPTIDQESAVVGREPTAALTGFRMWENIHGVLQPIFGENVTPQSSGTIQVGDPIKVLELRQQPLVFGSLIDMKARQSVA